MCSQIAVLGTIIFKTAIYCLPCSLSPSVSITHDVALALPLPNDCVARNMMQVNESHLEGIKMIFSAKKKSIPVVRSSSAFLKTLDGSPTDQFIFRCYQGFLSCFVEEHVS